MILRYSLLAKENRIAKYDIHLQKIGKTEFSASVQS